MVLSNAERLIEQFDVRTPGPLIPAGNLSGGNQQKVIVAREFSRPVKLLVANQPTRGLDVGSIEYIHKPVTWFGDRCTRLGTWARIDAPRQTNERARTLEASKNDGGSP